MGEDASTVVIESEGESAVMGASVSRRARARTLVIVASAALVVAAGIAIAIVIALQQAAHQHALDEANSAHVTAQDAIAEQLASVESLEASVRASITLRDAVSADVLPHAGLLGGDAALTSLAKAHAELTSLIEDNVAGGDGSSDPALLDLPDAVTLTAVDPELGADELAVAAEQLTRLATQARAARILLTGRETQVASSAFALEAELASLVATLPSTHEALLSARHLATAESRAAADAALQAGVAAEVREAPALVAAYAAAAAGVVASHDAEAARLAAEEAARQAQQARRPSSGGGGDGGGGGGTVSNAVLAATNAQRAANGRSALSWSGSLASRSCTWASYLADGDKPLAHDTPPGGLWGENVAYGPKTGAGVVDLWMGSPGHRANILKPEFSRMGSCSATSATGRVYWVQQFG